MNNTCSGTTTNSVTYVNWPYYSGCPYAYPCGKKPCELNGYCPSAGAKITYSNEPYCKNSAAHE